METKFLRFDVDNPAKSVLRSFLSFRFPILSNLSYLKPILDLLHDYNQKGTFFFRPYYTMPSALLVKSLLRDGHEIGHHVDHTKNIAEMQKEKLRLESKCGKILGITIHGYGLPLVSPSGEAFHDKYFEYCVKLGYKYEGTGHYTDLLNKKLTNFDGMYVFPRHLTFDQFPKTDFDEKVMMAHPCRLARNKNLLRLFERVLQNYKFIPQREILNDNVRTKFSGT